MRLFEHEIKSIKKAGKNYPALRFDRNNWYDRSGWLAFVRLLPEDNPINFAGWENELF